MFVYEVWLLNNETGYEKGFNYKNYFTFECSPSIYSPSLATHLSMRFFHWSKQCWKSSLVRTFRRSAVFCFTASIDSNRVPFKTAVIFGNKKKSHGAKSGEYGACWSTGVRLSAKYRFTDSALWVGALSWCKIHELFFHNSGRFLRTRSRSVAKTDK